MCPAPLEVTSQVMPALMMASLDCIIIADHQGQIVEFNPSAENVFGYRRHEVLHKPMTDFIIPPHLRTAHTNGMTHYLRTGEGPVLNKRIEITAMRADGSEFPVELTIIPTEVDQQPLFVSFIRDISERRNNDQKLMRTSARLHQLIGNLQGGVLLENEHRQIELVNEAFCNMFDIPASPSALIGRDCSRSAEDTQHLFHQPDQFMTRIEKILIDRKAVTGDLLNLRDGRVFLRDYVPIYDGSEYVGHLWHYRDVTADTKARLRSERLLYLEEMNKEIIRLFLQLDNVDLALNEVLAMTGSTLDVSRTYVFHFRENERILDNTHEWCAAGIEPEIENLKGLVFDDLVPSFFPLLAQKGSIAPIHIDELPRDIRALLEPQGIQSLLILPLFSNGRIEGFIGCDENRHSRVWLPEEITTVRIIAESYARALEREQAKRMLIQARDEAIRTAKLRAQFVANMSHEIRTPMTGILGMLELLLETSLDELQHEFAQEAFSSGKRLLTIINDILDFSKLEAGQMVLENLPVSLEAIATEAQTTLMPQVKMREKTLEFHVDYDPQLPHRIYGDATRLRQVLLNLASNAIKFTQTGHVTLRLRLLKTVQKVAWIEFAVEDTGIGISSENVKRIFESFVQADGSVTRKYGGTGLGLSICKQLVELMGGTIEVNSVVGSGSIFSFILSLPIATPARSGDKYAANFSQLQILIIDAHSTGRYVLTQQLESWGATVVGLNHINDATMFFPEVTQQQARFDLLFIRWHDNCNLPNDVGMLARQIIYVSEKTDQLPADLPPNTSLLEWPVNQSNLYNLLLQTAQPVMPDIPPPADLAAVPPTRQRVLLADDYPINVAIVERAFASYQIDMRVVENGEQALAALAEETFDLLLLDIHMPVMDGIEVTRHIRNGNTAYRNMPILALTASVMRDEQQIYRAIGINEIISKPFSVHHLRHRVLHWLQKKPGVTPRADT